MQEPRDSVALAPVSLMSVSDIDRDVEITPPSSPHPPYTTGENESCQRSSDVSQSPVQKPLAPDGLNPPIAHIPPIDAPPSTRLRRSYSVLFLVAIYVVIVILAWVKTCQLTLRPITPDHYDVFLLHRGFNRYGHRDRYDERMRQNEGWITAMRALRAIAAVLTLPVASAVCASAAVAFVQRNATQSRLSIRQVMMLADRAWADPSSYGRALFSWKRYGSMFLLMAILVNLLGATIYPLQEGLLSSKTIKTPWSPQVIEHLLDIPDQLERKYNSYGGDILDVLFTRRAIETADSDARRPELWPGAGVTYYALNPNLPLNDRIHKPFSTADTTFNRVIGAEGSPNPFVAELPFGFNTGLIRQFLPRINSSAKYESIFESDYPTGCDTLPGAFYAMYTGTRDDDDCQGAWGLEVCMPGNMTKSPWISTRDRQDFSEVLYINTTLSGCFVEREPGSGRAEGSLFHRLTVDTTGGYFELPNYMNGGLAGPLLDRDPNSICGNDCYPQSYSTTKNISDNYQEERKAKRQSTYEADSATSISMEFGTNRGPLLTIAMALFDRPSFIATGVRLPEAYGAPGDPARYSNTCVDFTPLGRLLGLDYIYCISNADATYGLGIDSLMINFIMNFKLKSEILSKAFTSAAFLANHVWLTHPLDNRQDQWSLAVSFDMGADSQIPTISRGGSIAVSVVMGLFLATLLALVAYSLWTTRWTSRLDAFAMMRMGAAMPDRLPLLVGRNTDAIKALDDNPGWVGDATVDGELVHRLGLGAPRNIDGSKRYECYPGNSRLGHRVF